MSNLTNVLCVVSNSAGSASSVAWQISTIAQPTASYPRSVLALSPISYWRLNETPDNGQGNQGVICHDYAGGCNGVYSNVALGQPDYSQLVEPSGASALFGVLVSSNSAAGQIQCEDFGLSAGNNAEFSVSAWVNGSSHPQNLNAGIVSKGYFSAEEFDLDEGGPGACLHFGIHSASGIAYDANSTINVYTNSGWHHLVGVCDEANSAISLYVDGSLTGSAAMRASGGITNASSVPLTIGARASNSASGNDQQFFGMISDVALFNYALKPSQIQTLYQAGISLPPVSLTLMNMSNGAVQCNWNYGVLQSATNAAGPYQDLPGLTQPCTISTTNVQQVFYRVREN
jgi:hypothetical protein